ncbi:hypothetical protein N780_01825 [Pontibacillus chungwhensis BH030062]|uniref:DUF4362 domain-containing protein n=1 Tax=Pontibacillus chungwhensis BH030062 TaxID=1385513 RepID=A0A0A2UWK8_9BACI|nr:DUF4362 domain-containing protein [Pontibacillus chungwhensis]KGP92304.1 hypothetical protein N780_01825 [Pontibacillus chungwhensis BH030062]
MNKKTFVLIGTFLLMLSGCQSNENQQGYEGPEDTNETNVPEYVQSPEDIINMHGDITNVDTFYAFLESVNEGKEDEIRVVTYTTEGDPMLHDLKYDGEVIHSIKDTRRDSYGPGNVNEATCESIKVAKSEERTEYVLSGCDQGNNMILVIK